MPSRCIAELDSGRLLPIARIRSPAPSTWNSCCNQPGISDKMCAQIERTPAMKRALLFILVSLLGAASVVASESNPVSYKSGDETVQGILYTPAGKGPFPGLIVIHEYWGLNDWVKEQASKLSDQGYVALAIDLYRGEVATTPDEAPEIMRGVPEDRAKRDLPAAFEFLTSQPDVKKDRIGAIGW